MPILFGVVSRGNTVLAKYASCAGNFTEVVEQVLVRISPENAKLTYTHESYLFHYITENKIIYLCITDDDFERSKAFSFLQEIKRRFSNQFGYRAHTALPYAMNSEFSQVLSAQMRHFSSDSADIDKVSQVQGQVDELKDIMVRNIDNIASRGEKLELLVETTENLSQNSITFKKSSRSLARSMWWKNAKLTIIIVVIILVIIFIIVTISCGGFSYGKCKSK